MTTKRVPHNSGEPYDHHFFVSSVAEWRVSEDLMELIRGFDRAGYRYCIWYIPKPVDAPYSIEYYAPQVEGAISLGAYDPPSKKKQ